MSADVPSSATGGFGLIITKASLRRLEIPVRHELTAQGGGWRLDLRENGKITAHYEHGQQRDGIDVEEGDYILSAGPDLYLSLQSLKVREKPSVKQREEDERRDEKEQRREKKQGGAEAS